jgi:hypothetical protein
VEAGPQAIEAHSGPTFARHACFIVLLVPTGTITTVGHKTYHPLLFKKQNKTKLATLA